MKKQRMRSRKPRLTVVGILCADRATPLYPQKVALTMQKCGGRPVDAVFLRTESHDVCFRADFGISDINIKINYENILLKHSERTDPSIKSKGIK
jgi:hypothetical protein